VIGSSKNTWSESSDRKPEARELLRKGDSGTGILDFGKSNGLAIMLGLNIVIRGRKLERDEVERIYGTSTHHRVQSTGRDPMYD